MREIISFRDAEYPYLDARLRKAWQLVVDSNSIVTPRLRSKTLSVIRKPLS